MKKRNPTSYLIAATALLCFGGSCRNETAKPQQRVQAEGIDAAPDSESYLLEVEEYAAFKVGKKKHDILSELHWKGNVEEIAEIEGKVVTAISYGLYGGPHSEDPRAAVVWAIFVDDKFDKFVEPPQWGRMPYRMGDHRRLLKAFQAAPV